MILDSSKVSLANGQHEAAIDLQPGRELISYQTAKIARTTVTAKKTGSGMEVIGLVLSNGQRLCGTRTHQVALYRNGRMFFREFAEIKIGDSLRGEQGGMPVVVKVIGLLYFPRKEVRLVGVETNNGRPYVAEGVLCR